VPRTFESESALLDYIGATPGATGYARSEGTHSRSIDRAVQCARQKADKNTEEPDSIGSGRGTSQ
jgi:hypothetical protein